MGTLMIGQVPTQPWDRDDLEPLGGGGYRHKKLPTCP